MSNYITFLSQEEKIIFLQLIFNLICSDKNITTDEREFMQQLIRSYNIPTSLYGDIMLIRSKEEIQNLAKQISMPEKQIALLIELFMVAHIDNQLADSELDYLINIAETFNISEYKIEAINRYCLNKINNQLELNELMAN